MSELQNHIINFNNLVDYNEDLKKRYMTGLISRTTFLNEFKFKLLPKITQIKNSISDDSHNFKVAHFIKHLNAQIQSINSMINALDHTDTVYIIIKDINANEFHTYSSQQHVIAFANYINRSTRIETFDEAIQYLKSKDIDVKIDDLKD